LKVRKNDNVIMRNGKDSGKTGKILFTFPSENRVVVEGLNLVKRHLRARRQGQKGQIVNKERSVNVSSVQLMCPKCSKPTRIGYLLEGDSKVRICKKCNGEI